MRKMSDGWNKTGEEILTADKRKITTTIATAPASDLKFDGDNPRLHYARMQHNKGNPLTQEESEKHLWGFDSVKSLLGEIINAGGLTEPLYVNSTNVVLEGNERLCCLRQIAKGLESGDDYYTDHAERLTFLINNVPVRILPDDVTSREIAMMHADWHIGSKDPWKPINQARHIYEMVNHGISKDEIASRLRKSRPWVYGKLAAYEMAEKHFDRHARWEETSEFSYFEELYKKKKALSDHGFDIEVEENFEKFSDWVVEKNIPKALDVRKLTKVFSYPETKELIFNGEGSRAFKELAIYDASSASPRFAAIERLNNQLRKMNWEDFRMIATNESHRELVQETISRLQKTLETVDSMEWE